MEILENKSLASLSTLKIGGVARYFAVIDSEDDVNNLYQFAKEKALSLTIIGKGSNSIFKEGTINRVIGLMNIPGIRTLHDFETSVQVQAGAGVIWDDLVSWSVENGLTGIEALSAIPGTVGAAPVQNIGAYGSELKDTFVNVHAFDTEQEKMIIMGLNDCNFSYRDSIFKQNPGRFIITSLTIELSRKKPELPKYKDVQLYFLGAKRNPSLKQIRKAICQIRWKKLPDPTKIPNAGSFFKNPIVNIETFTSLLKKNPDMPHFEAGENKIKLYAGWMIEKTGFKGKDFGLIYCYKNNALVLVTKEGAGFKDLEEVKNQIINTVKSKFGIELEMEPNIIG